MVVQLKQVFAMRKQRDLRQIRNTYISNLLFNENQVLFLIFYQKCMN